MYSGFADISDLPQAGFSRPRKEGFRTPRVYSLSTTSDMSEVGRAVLPK